MSDTCRLFPPFGDPWPSCLLPSQNFVDKTMSLVFTMLSRLVIAFLPRSKHLLISCPPKYSLSLFPLFPHLFAMKWWNYNTLATWWEELTHLKGPWCWERFRAGGEGDDRGWDGWMASPTQRTWVCITLGVGDGQGGLTCCGSWGRKESDMTELLN